ncbi:MAG: hypothetical protein ACRBK7_09105 [Acidimicrobiales bacterium]
MMLATESGRTRRTIGITSRATAAAAAMLCLCLTSCVSGADDDTIGPKTTSEAADSSANGGLGNAGIGSLAFTGPSTFAPLTAPSGTPYQTCSISYRNIDWEAEPEAIVESHTSASTAACANEAWYRDTAFQNGILTFMALVGEQALADAAPSSDLPATMAASLRSQGFDRLAAIDIITSGRCEQGEVQAALFTLRDSAQAVEGLQSLLDSAEASGAVIDRGQNITVISGAGAPCVTAVVHGDAVLGWITTADIENLELAMAEIKLPYRSDRQ